MSEIREPGRTETITERDALSIRRQLLEPGEATPWHTDICERFSVVIRGDRLTIEYRDSGESVEVPLHPGMAVWDAPDDRVHRGVNTGSSPYEEVVTFFLDAPRMEPQPEPEPEPDEADAPG